MKGSAHVGLQGRIAYLSTPYFASPDLAGRHSARYRLVSSCGTAGSGGALTPKRTTEHGADSVLAAPPRNSGVRIVEIKVPDLISNFLLRPLWVCHPFSLTFHIHQHHQHSTPRTRGIFRVLQAHRRPLPTQFNTLLPIPKLVNTKW